MTLTELIAAIEAGPVTRELNDEVLLACTEWKQGKSNLDYWQNPDGSWFWKTRPSPLSDLQDATLAVPNGTTDVLCKSQLLPEQRHDVVIWVPIRGKNTIFQGVSGIDATALVPACLKAREQEAEDG